MPSADAQDRNAFAWSGRAPAVLLIHGFTGSPWEIRPVADALRAQGYACSGPMLPGHGTTPSDLSRVVWADFSRAVDAVLEGLLAAHGAVVLVGQSLGGLLAIEAAAHAQDRGVVGLVTLAGALSLTPGSTAVIRAARALGSMLPNVSLPKIGGSDIQDRAMQHANPAYPAYPLRALREFDVGQRVARAVLPTLRVPLLAMHGLLDATTPLESSLEILALAGSRDASLVVLPRSGHVLGVDLDRAAVAHQVCAFVERIARARTETAPEPSQGADQ